jgi:hypothetical protein
VLDALAVHALADAGLVQEPDGALLEHAGTDTVLDVLTAAVLEHDRLDAGPVEQLRERQAGGPGPDDADLRSQRRP